MREYYKILGVNSNSSQDEIKKAYKKSAMKWHPDRNKDNKEKAENQFKKITTAYTVLSDPNKKDIYDKFGEEGLQNNNNHSNVNPMDIFGNLFGNSGFSFNFNNDFSHNFNKQTRKNKPIIKHFPVSLEDLYKGKTIKFSITRKVIDKDKRHLVKTCDKCKGKGIYVEVRQMGPMIQQIQQQCNNCNGIGKNIPNNIIKNEKNIVELEIKPGMQHGEKIVIPNMGDNINDNIEPSDLVFVLQQEKNNTFNISDKHLIIEKNIQLIDALCGCEFIITHLDNRKLLVETNDIIKPNDIKVIKYEGMSSQNSSNGDLIIKFNIIFPNNLLNKDDLINLLPKSKLNDINHTPDLTHVHLSDFNEANYEQHNQQQSCNQQ